MTKCVLPSEIGGTVTAPASKSGMQRAAAAGLLSEAALVISNPSFSEDSLAALGAARALGARVEREKDRVVIRGGAGAGAAELDCGESGLCARLFTPIAALRRGEIRLTGRGTLLRRPLGPIEAPLAALGAACATSGGFLPLTVRGPLRGGRTDVDASGGSQFLTGLLMALPKASGDSVLTVPRLVSQPYIRMTLKLLADFGVSVVHEDFRVFRIAAGQRYRRDEYRVEGDWSGAASLLVAAALAGRVRVLGLDPDSPQGDKRILEALEAAGAGVFRKGSAIEIAKAPLRGFEFDVTDCPDLAPPLVALAARASGVSAIAGIERLVFKESRRAETLAEAFGALGVDIRFDGGRMVVRGGPVRGGPVDSRADHRLAMAAAVAALAAEGGVEIAGAECVDKSYPGFFRDLRTLGGRIDE